MRWALIVLLKAYRRVISPLYGDVCRYYPSCSAYALEAVEAHGAPRGSWLAARRVGRCHPWAAGGVDPVPPTFHWRSRPAGPDETPIDPPVRTTDDVRGPFTGVPAS
jgi:putative membrane protein insertion efficiency factor